MTSITAGTWSLPRRSTRAHTHTHTHTHTQRAKTQNPPRK